MSRPPNPPPRDPTPPSDLGFLDDVEDSPETSPQAPKQTRKKAKPKGRNYLVFLCGLWMHDKVYQVGETINLTDEEARHFRGRVRLLPD